MPNTREVTTTEFGWNGVDGYVRNKGKYTLLLTKPSLSFTYDSIMYSSDALVEDMLVKEAQVFPLEPEELVEVNNYAIEHALDDPWASPSVPPLVQTLETIDLVSLAGDGFTPTRSSLVRTLATEHDGTPAVYHRLTVIGTFDITTGVIPLKVLGMFQDGQYGFINMILVNGSSIDPADSSKLTVHANLEKQQTNALEVLITQDELPVAEGHLQVIIEFVLPNQDYGVGTPFPSIQ